MQTLRFTRQLRRFIAANRLCMIAALLLGASALSIAQGTATNPANTTNVVRSNQQNQASQTILVLGDSISAAYGIDAKQGWVALLSDRLNTHTASFKRPYTVQNASISGDTTAGGAQRLPALLKRHQPAIVVIELGGNDALRGLPLSQTEANFKRMIHAAKVAKATVLLVPMQIPPNYGASYAQGFNGLYARLGKTHKVAVSAFIFKDFAQDLSRFQADRIHPTVAAQGLMLNAVWPALSSVLKP